MMGRNKETYLIYIGVAAALLPVILLRDFTPANELRYLSIADEALRNHTYMTFTNHGMPYTDKPPLYLWAVMLCRWITGAHHMWLLSLLSLLPAWVTAHTMDRWTACELQRSDRTLVQLMLLTSILFIGAAVTLRMDMLMCCFIVLALHQFWLIDRQLPGYKRARWLWPLYLFLAVFTKGPLGLLIPLCGTVVYLATSHRLATIGRTWGWRTWALLAGCCAAWFGAVAAEGGSQYLSDMLFRQTAGRAVHSFHHAAPPYYYAVSLWYCMAPWSLLVVGAVATALRPGSSRTPLRRLMLSVGLSAMVLLSCISAKLQIYMLPAIPFLVYAAAMALPQTEQSRWARWAIAVPAVLLALALPGLAIAAPMADGSAPYLSHPLCYAAATLLTLGGMAALYIICRKKATATGRAIHYMATALLAAVFVGAWALPRINPYTGYAALCRQTQQVASRQGITDIRTWHLPRPENIDVYLGHPVAVIEGDEPPTASRHPYLLLTRSRELTRFSGRPSVTIGPYAVVTITPDNPRQ